MNENVNIRKIYSTVERMNGWKSSIEIIIIPLKERMATAFLGNKDTNAERITLAIDDCKIYREINTVSFIEWMTANFSVRETNNLLQRMDGYN